MAEVFVSYAREDRDRAERLVKQLEAHRISVWIDRDLSAGRVWRPELERRIREARAVVVCWSDHTNDPESFVYEEARLARTLGTYVPVLFEGVPPFGFTLEHALSLLHTREGIDATSMLRLLEALAPKLQRQDLSEVAKAGLAKALEDDVARESQRQADALRQIEASRRASREQADRTRKSEAARTEEAARRLGAARARARPLFVVFGAAIGAALAQIAVWPLWYIDGLFGFSGPWHSTHFDGSHPPLWTVAHAYRVPLAAIGAVLGALQGYESSRRGSPNVFKRRLGYLGVASLVAGALGYFVFYYFTPPNSAIRSLAESTPEIRFITRQDGEWSDPLYAREGHALSQSLNAIIEVRDLPNNDLWSGYPITVRFRDQRSNGHRVCNLTDTEDVARAWCAVALPGNRNYRVLLTLGPYVVKEARLSM